MKDQIETDQAIPNILVVDDVPANLKLLDDILKYEGYKTRPVPNGELALRAAEKEKPDLILLDIMMPGIDGFEVCRRLKENPELKDIPVIFISALGDTGNILKAFAVGGVDYINKPFQTAEVKARVQTHLKMHRQSRELRELNATLEFKVEERTRDLQDANRVKGEFLARASHEMRTPMNAILGFAQLLNMGELSPNQKKGINHILTSGKHLLGLINDVLDLSNIDTGRLPLLHEPVMLAEVVEEAVETVRPLAIARQINLEFVNPAASRLFVMSDRKRLNQALMNLLTNAVKYNREAGAIFVKTEMRPMNDTDIVSARISVTDTGWGISPEDIPKLFMPFERIGAEKTQTEGVGVGLALVKKIMDALEGTVGVESIVGKGSTFWIDLPGNI
jgi:signal transduction histidine kinase